MQEFLTAQETLKSVKEAAVRLKAVHLTSEIICAMHKVLSEIGEEYAARLDQGIGSDATVSTLHSAVVNLYDEYLSEHLPLLEQAAEKERKDDYQQLSFIAEALRADDEQNAVKHAMDTHAILAHYSESEAAVVMRILDDLWYPAIRGMRKEPSMQDIAQRTLTIIECFLSNERRNI